MTNSVTAARAIELDDETLDAVNGGFYNTTKGYGFNTGGGTDTMFTGPISSSKKNRTSFSTNPAQGENRV